MSKVELNEEKLMELTGKVFENVSAAGSLLVAYIGDQAGVYSSLDEHGPCSAEALAKKTNLTLIGRAKGKKYTVLSGKQRIKY